MCSYVRRDLTQEEYLAYLKKLGFSVAMDTQRPWTKLQNFYPAFGGNATRQIKDMLIMEDGVAKTVNATWWHQCTEVNGHLVVGPKTTFNARNLELEYWKESIRSRRGLVLATATGESIKIEKKTFQYLIESEQPILMGAVYNRFPNDLYSAAIITRDPHERFKQYHEKAFPFLLPNDPAVIELWLSDEPETHPEIAHLLSRPHIYNALKVTHVKTFKDGLPLGQPEIVIPD